jgi:3-hydroxyisobutyrate dehydrogenase-like beta-hydroxyacid dehydrogenase
MASDASPQPAAERPTSVTVIGLGAMGAALARAFLAAGHPTTVWNRSPGRSDDLAKAGAAVAGSAAEAIDASDLVILCVLDRSAVDAVLDAALDQLPGATVVNLTSSLPEDARELSVRVADAGARYLDGKIMATVPMVGTDDALILYSGDRAVFDDHRGALAALGGEADFMGADAGRAAVHDLAMLDIFFNGMTAFLHAAVLVEADGVSAKALLPYAQRTLAVLGAVIPGLAADVDSREHPGHEDNLEMNAAFLGHIVEASRTGGIDVTVPAVSHALAEAAIAAGGGRDGYSRIADVLRRPTSGAAA